MKIEILKSKIHRATVTDANLNYVGSLSLDENLIKAANLHEYEKIQVLNITNGNRLETYVIKAPAGSGEVCVNGAAAHLVSTGDLIIIASYCQLDNSEVGSFKPTIVLLDQNNNMSV